MKTHPVNECRACLKFLMGWGLGGLVFITANCTGFENQYFSGDPHTMSNQTKEERRFLPDATLQREASTGAIRFLKAANLSILLEQEDPAFKKLQSSHQLEKVAFAFLWSWGACVYHCQLYRL